ncbi:2-oxo-4-hydroxy-4-carboxy-5-ureidoimidazoline decarboxylase [Streptomyces sp. NPDC004609]|uniref:2-oxo-4-hydroxy-4-carboxy-5-ureidoimidazoline decarboxylase n=1 Tax=Streptomyces sp. NPDC004609 TaxID=3364704 RepID=UPI00369943FD
MPSRPQRVTGKAHEPSAGLTRFNTAPEGDAIAALHEVCASSAWGSALLAGRPYATTEALLTAADAAVAGLTDAHLAEAMAGHPPIGRPRPGDPTSSREQSGMAGASDTLRAEMLELNLAYQEKFGHVFLICATGLTGERMRDAVRSRIGNTPEREREIVRTELGRINRIRLARLVEVTEAADDNGAIEVTKATGETAEKTGNTGISGTADSRGD